MVTRYAFLWHVLSTEDCAAALCESVKTEAPTAWEAEEKLVKWLKQRQEICTEEACDCKKGEGFITDMIDPDMIMGGMTQGMVTIS